VEAFRWVVLHVAATPAERVARQGTDVDLVRCLEATLLPLANMGGMMEPSSGAQMATMVQAHRPGAAPLQGPPGTPLPSAGRGWRAWAVGECGALIWSLCPVAGAFPAHMGGGGMGQDTAMPVAMGVTDMSGMGGPGGLLPGGRGREKDKRVRVVPTPPRKDWGKVHASPPDLH